MSTVVEVRDERREPLLHNSSLPLPHGELTDENEAEIVSSSPSGESEGPESSIKGSNQRLVSLDVFRGLTVALMILVDDAGGAFTSINHSPWFGVTIADFVMPFFLFGVGVSVSLVFKKASGKLMATKKVILRTVKLFLLGLLLQGGYFHGRNNLTYGVDVDKIRWLGVLQRISIGYLLTSVSEIWLVNNIMVDSPAAFVRKYYVQWIFALLILTFYTCLLYGLYVPNWEFQSPSMNLSVNGSDTQIVHCGVRGSLEPPCNAVGYIDRYFLGEQHLYQHPVYRRTKECSVNSPDYGSLPLDSPVWCLAPFDPEGILRSLSTNDVILVAGNCNLIAYLFGRGLSSSLMAVLTCFMGLHFGHILLLFKEQMQNLLLWFTSSFLLLVSGYILRVLGIPFSKPLYTLSYMCITAGASGLLLTIIFYIVDVKHFRKPTSLLEWVGMNALIIYALAACEIFPAVVQGFYWRSPENNLVDATQSLLQTMLHSKKWGTLLFVMLEILFWCLVAGFLHVKGIYVRV